MKTTLRLSSFIICLCLLLSFMSSCNKKDTEDTEVEGATEVIDTSGIEFVLNEDGASYTVANFHRAAKNGILTIPDKYNGLPVTRIGATANGMGEATIKKIILPDTIEVIEESAFMHSSSLESIEFGNGLRVIEDTAFEYCEKLTEVVFPSSLTYLGLRAFQNCTSIKRVVFSENLSTVFPDAFMGCDSLEILDMPTSGEKFICKNNCLINKISKTLVIGCKNSVIPQDEGILHISANAFAECKGLTSVALPYTLQTIGADAFFSCSSLTEVVIPRAVRSIASNAFSDCSGLQKVNVESGSSLEYIGNHAFGKCTSLTSITIPNSVKALGDFVFLDCPKIQGTQYESVIYIGSSENPYLVLLRPVYKTMTGVRVHQDTKFIDSLAFSGLNSLTAVSLPEGLLGIGGYAFSGCPIENFKLPSTVKYLGEMPFSISIDGNHIDDPDYSDLTIYDNAYYVGSEDNPYMVLVGAINKDITSCKIHHNTKIIYSDAFGSCAALTEVVFEDNSSLQRIEENAFWGCTSLRSLTIPDSVNSIGYMAFDECPALTTLENGVVYVGNWAVGINRLLSDGVTLNTKMTDFAIKDGTRGIADQTFNLFYISSLILPKSLEYIGENCFNTVVIDKIYYSDCKCSFEQINIDYGNTEIKNATMYYYESKPNIWHYVDGVPTPW